MNEKGSSWQLVLEFLESLYDEQQLETVKQSLTADDRMALFRRKIFSISWVNYYASTRFLLTADKLLGQGDKALIRRCAQYQAQQELDSVQRLIFRLRSPFFLLKKIGQVWPQNYNQGRAEVEKIDKNSALFKVYDVPAIPLHHEIRHNAWIEEALMLTGCAHVSSDHQTCMARGDEYCSTLISWGKPPQSAEVK